MKRARFWLLVFLVLACRALSYFLLKAETAYVFVPRSFFGGGFQSQPAILDLVVPVIVVFYLWPGRLFEARTARSWGPAVWDGLFLLLFPLLAGLSLFAYLARWQIFSNLTLDTLLRWLQFLGAYVACNIFLDELPLRSRWLRVVIATILALSFGPLQDAYPRMGNNGLLLLSMSVGLTLTWTVLALRRRYCQSPRSAVLAAGIVGAVSSLLVVMAPSNSLFPFLLPMFALPLGAFVIRSERAWPRWAALASVVVVGLLLSLVLPKFLPPLKADLLAQEPPPSHAEEVEGVTVRYDDVRVREVALRLAHVLAAANLVSQEAYGISPQVAELVIRGFEPGGFRGEFPHEIHGNFPSQRYTDLCLDSSFLNDPNTSIHFPDPVNAILHEYSHLYGIVPYLPWVIRGASEEEGWATFSATRLSRKLYERFGPSLWNPPYNYAARADVITQSNLAGHPVYWSHPKEYGGFRLWYLLAQRDGETALYRKRWALTRRDYGGWWFQISDPGAARKMAKALGFTDFVSFGSGQAVRYDQVYAMPDLLAAQLPLGQTAGEVRMDYARNASRLVDPTVKVPPQRPLALDMGLSMVLLAVYGMIKRTSVPLTQYRD